VSEDDNMRAVPEWIGKNPDQQVPLRVRLRIFERNKGICYLSGVKIQPGDKWEVEHRVSLCNGGEHRESNMAPALVGPHKAKTRQDRAIKAKNDRVRKKHIGLRKPSSFACSRDSAWKRKINGQVEKR